MMLQIYLPIYLGYRLLFFFVALIFKFVMYDLHQDQKELADFVAGMLSGEDASSFLRELNEKRKNAPASATSARDSVAGSNESRQFTAAGSVDAGRLRQVDEYRDLLHLSGRFVIQRLFSLKRRRTTDHLVLKPAAAPGVSSRPDIH